MACISGAGDRTPCGFFRFAADVRKCGGDHADPADAYGGVTDQRFGICLRAPGQICKYGEKHPEKCGHTGVCETAAYDFDRDHFHRFGDRHIL